MEATLALSPGRGTWTLGADHTGIVNPPVSDTLSIPLQVKEEGTMSPIKIQSQV